MRVARRGRRRLRDEAVRHRGAARAHPRRAAPGAARRGRSPSLVRVDDLEIDLAPAPRDPRRRAGAPHAHRADAARAARAPSRASCSPRSTCCARCGGRGTGPRATTCACTSGSCARSSATTRPDPRLILTEPGIGYRWIAGEEPTTGVESTTLGAMPAERPDHGRDRPAHALGPRVVLAVPDVPHAAREAARRAAADARVGPVVRALPARRADRGARRLPRDPARGARRRCSASRPRAGSRSGRGWS